MGYTGTVVLCFFLFQRLLGCFLGLTHALHGCFGKEACALGMGRSPGSAQWTNYSGCYPQASRRTQEKLKPSKTML